MTSRLSAMRLLAAILLLLCGPAGQAPAELVRDRHVAAELVSEEAGIQPGGTLTVALRLVHDESWHTYWINPGTGYPTSLNWELPEGFSAAEGFDWPTPKVYEQAGFVNYVHEGEIFLLTEVTAPDDLEPGSSVILKAQAEWLMCDPETCVPGEVPVSLTLPVVAEAPGLHPEWGKAVAAAREALPRSLPGWTLSADREGDRVTLTVTGEGDRSPGEGLYFFSRDALISADAPQAVEADGNGAQLTLEIAVTAPETDRLVGVLHREGGWADGLPGMRVDLSLAGEASTALAASAAGAAGAAAGGEAPAADYPLPLVLLLAFAGGLILNLMPCVFPVLGIKVMGFVRQAGESRASVAMHGISFTGGVLVSFWIVAAVLIALRAGGEQLGWGFQLQSPGFVFVLAMVLLVFGLSLSGLFEFGTSATQLGTHCNKRGCAGSFLSGVLATVVATPCAAPFLAYALGAALTLPAATSILVFTFIGIGLSSPYLLLALFPKLLQMMPKPGAWMETFKQAMAFPVYATVAYLLWVLAEMVDAWDNRSLLMVLLGMILAAMAAWIYGRFGGLAARSRPWRAHTAAVLLLAGALALGWPRAPETEFTTASGETVPRIQWEAWSPERQRELREAGTPVYVDFTAVWCVTCQTNKATVLASDSVHEAFYRKGIVALKADWTSQDPRIAAALEEFGRAAVPFNVLYPGGMEEPIILPEILTPGIVLDAIARIPESATAGPAATVARK